MRVWDLRVLILSLFPSLFFYSQLAKICADLKQESMKQVRMSFLVDLKSFMNLWKISELVLEHARWTHLWNILFTPLQDNVENNVMKFVIKTPFLTTSRYYILAILHKNPSIAMIRIPRNLFLCSRPYPSHNFPYHWL